MPGGDIYQKCVACAELHGVCVRAVADVVAKAPPSSKFWFSSEREPNEPVRKITFLNSLILPLNVICTYLDYLWFLMILVQA